METSKEATIRLAKEYAEKGNPNGWFEEFYARADGDIRNVYWADLKPNPLLIDWVDKHPAPAGKRAVVIGCGLGDDAELLAQRGYQVIAFDISSTAIAMCRQRYPGSEVEYRTADLFRPPEEWRRGFDLIYECNTIQSLRDRDRQRAVAAIADLLAPGGDVIVSCRSRNAGEGLDEFPIALDKEEINGFLRAGLTGIHFLEYDDDQDPPVPHFFGVYRRSA